MDTPRHLNYGAGDVGGHLSHLFGRLGSDSQVLFHKQMLVYVKNSTNDQRRTNLSICIQDGRIPYRQILIQIQDPEDPFFLYNLSLAEDEFNRLKSSQGLLIQFQDFPQKLIEFLELCLDNQHLEQPKFIVSLNAPLSSSSSSRDIRPSSQSSALFEIIEANNSFKHLIHLSLRIPPANEATIRNHICQFLSNSKGENERIRASLVDLDRRSSDTVNHLTDQLATASQKLESVDKEWEERLGDVKSSHEAKIKQLQLELTRAQENISELEHDNRSLSDQLEVKSSELDSALEQLNHLGTETSNAYKFAPNEDLQSRISSLLGRIGEKEAELAVLHHDLLAQTREKESIAQIADKRLKLLEKSEKISSQLSEDLTKANEIISRLQAEIQSSSQKMNVLSKVASKQDQLVDGKDSKVKHLEHDLKLCLERLRSKETDQECMRRELDDLRQKYMLSQEQIKSNENVIHWLNEKLNEIPPDIPISNLKGQPSKVQSTARPVTAPCNNANKGRLNGHTGRIQPMSSKAPQLFSSQAQRPPQISGRDILEDDPRLTTNLPRVNVQYDGLGPPPSPDPMPERPLTLSRKHLYIDNAPRPVDPAAFFKCTKNVRLNIN